VSTLPRGWTSAKVSALGKVQLGRQRSPEHHSGDNMRPYLRVANVFEDRIDTSDVLSMNFTPEEYERYALRDGDILLNEGQSRELVGRPAIYRSEFPGACFQNTLIRFQAGPALLPEFALAVFRHYLHTGKFAAISKWTTSIAHLGAERFAALELPVPPLGEQRRIVAKLNALFARIRAAKSSLERVLKLLEGLRKAVLSAAFRGDFHEKFTLVKSGHKQSTAWQCLPLSKFSRSGRPVVKAGPFGSALKKSQYVSAGYKVYGQEQVIADDFVVGDYYISEALFQKLSSCDVQPGDVLISLVGTFGKVAVVPSRVQPGIINPRLIRISVDGDRLNPEFLALYLRSPHVQNDWAAAAHGGTMGILNSKHLLELLVPAPEMAVQRALVAFVNRFNARVDALFRRLNAAKSRSDELEHASLAAAFCGALVPQDPSDEPASVLLERINAEREAPQPMKSKRGARTSAPTRTRASKGA